MADFETFNLVFKADSTQLKKEVDSVKQKTDDLTKTTKDAEHQAKKTDSAFAELGKSLAGVAAAYFSIGAVVGGFRSSIANTSELLNVSRTLNLNISTLDAWRKALKNFGVESSEFETGVSGLQKVFGTSAQNAVDLLPLVSSRLKAMGHFEAHRYGEGIGLPSGFIEFLRSPDWQKQLAIQKEIGVTSKEDAQRVAEYNKATGELADSFSKLYNNINVDLLPNLIKLSNTIKQIVDFISSRGENGFKGYFESIFAPTEEQHQDYLNAEELQKEILDSIKNWFLGGPNAAESQAANSYMQIPTSFAPVSNSQAMSVHTGDINVVSATDDPKGFGAAVSNQITAKLDLYSQLQQTNSYSDDGILV